MEIIFYLLAILGSSSLGYSLMRTGFPQTQSFKLLNKITLGYALGLVVVVPAIIAAWFFGVASFFLIMGLVFCLLFAIFIVKRISYNDKETVPLMEKEKKKFKIPKKILATDEKEDHKDTKKQVKGAVQMPSYKPAKIKEHIFKEKQPNVIAQLRKKTTAIENEKNKEDKEEALRKMKNFATQINKKKTKKNVDEIDEDELNNLDEGF